MARFSRRLLFRQGSAPVIGEAGPSTRAGAHNVPAMDSAFAGALLASSVYAGADLVDALARFPHRGADLSLSPSSGSQGSWPARLCGNERGENP